MPKTLPNTTPQSDAATKAIAAATTGSEPLAIIAKPDAETAAITKALLNAIDEYAEPALAVSEASEASKAANAAAEGARERLIKRMVAIADKAGWNNPDKIRAGGDAAVAAYNERRSNNPMTKATLSQLRTELCRAMHPSARPYVANAFEDAKVCWREEREAVADAKEAIDAAKAEGKKGDDLPPAAETPLLKTFAKPYHLVAGNKGILQAHIDADDPKSASVTSHEEAADPHMLAETRNRVVRQDPKTAARTLAKLVDTIEAIYAEFPAASLATMANFARNLNAKALEDAKVMARAKAEITAKRNAAPSATPRKAHNAIDELVGDAADELIG